MNEERARSCKAHRFLLFPPVDSVVRPRCIQERRSDAGAVMLSRKEAARPAKHVIFDVTKDSPNGLRPPISQLIQQHLSQRLSQLTQTSRNCTKHNVRCAYQDDLDCCDASTSSESVRDSAVAVTTTKPNARWPAPIRAEVRQWRKTGVMPFAHLAFGAEFQASIYSEDELCHLYHIMRLYHQLRTLDASHLTAFSSLAPSFFRIGSKSRLVMNSLLALSASHLLFSSDSSSLRYKAYHYKTMAIQDLRQTLQALSPENADEVLAGSITLLFLSDDWNGWTQVSQGILSVLSICRSWGHESELVSAASQLTDNSLTTNDDRDTEEKTLNFHHINSILLGMKKFGDLLQDQESQGGDLQRLQLLIKFTDDIIHLDASATPSERFESMRFFRRSVLWIPVSGIVNSGNISSALMVNAYLYSMFIQTRRLFPDVPGFWSASEVSFLLEGTLYYLKMYGEYNTFVDGLQAITSVQSNLECVS